MKKILICAAAIGAALAFTAPASAKGGHGRGHGWGHGYGHAKVMPLRSNRGGYLRGRARADYVHSLNRAKRYRY